MTIREKLLGLKKYAGKKKNGWEIDKETGAIIVYALNAAFLPNEDEFGLYYSLETGKPLQFSNNYIRSIRAKIGIEPMEAAGAGVIVYRNNQNGETQFLLQLRSDLGQYGIFGGAIELGEDYKICAISELIQEAGLLTYKKDLVLLDVYAGPKHITRYPSGDLVFHTVVVYSVEYNQCIKKNIPIDEETKELTWMTKTQLEWRLWENPEQFFPNNIPILEDVVNKFF